MAWADDGKSLFLANEEGGMSAVKIDAVDPSRPRIVSKRGVANFLWAVAQRNGILAFYQSYGDSLLRFNPTTFSLMWGKRLGSESHSVETDGSRIFVAIEGRPGRLIVLDPAGNELARVAEPDGWWNVYSTIYDADSQRLYIAAGENPAQQFAGAVYIYDVRQTTPELLGKINAPSWDIAVKGTRLWRQWGRSLETWDVSNPALPRLVPGGAWNGSTERGPGGTMVRPQLGHMTVNGSGTRLYITYRSVTESGGNQVLDWNAGFMIFDVSGSTPVPLGQRQGWKTSTGLWILPTSVALAPNERILAVSYWTFGVRFYEVAGDVVRELGAVATTGEAHDVYVDNRGILHVFANDSIQSIDPARGEHGEHVGVFVTGSTLDGGWRPFKDGTIVLPSARNSHSRIVLRIRDGMISYVTALGNPGSGGTWDEIFDDPLLYSATDNGLAVQRVGSFDPRTQRYPISVLGTVDVGGKLLAVTKVGNVVWGLGPTVGVVAIDVSMPTAPRLLFRDSISFGTNGNHAGIVAARGKIYAGVGDAGIIIYDAVSRRRTGQPITGLNVNFLDVVGSDFLVVANYWFPKVMEGMVIYDLRQSPDAPIEAKTFPGDQANPNFRARVIGGRIYRVPLYGVDVLEIQ
jgi:hypothetical protein